MTSRSPTVRRAALRVLESATSAAKLAAAQELAHALSGLLDGDPAIDVPDRPARPVRPLLVPPNRVPRRSFGTVEGRAALLHAVAHIEFNAIDLAADLIARFSADPRLPAEHRGAFVRDWVGVCGDEARHFTLLRARLNELGHDYGDFPAHDGLWQAAQRTAHDLAARLAIVPLVLEARGLDVTPGMIDGLKRAGDRTSASCLQVILEEEVAHVGAGWRWFCIVCEAEARPVEATFTALVAAHFPGGLKPPFNEAARRRAGLLPHLYGAGAGSGKRGEEKA